MLLWLPKCKSMCDTFPQARLDRMTSFVQKLHLDRLCRWGRCSFECFSCLLKRESMGDKGLQVDEPFRDESDRLGICLHISELETDIDLVERCVGEWVLVHVLAANANNEDLAAKFGRLGLILAEELRKVTTRNPHISRYGCCFQRRCIQSQVSPPGLRRT
jgi:hypothetical protein